MKNWFVARVLQGCFVHRFSVNRSFSVSLHNLHQSNNCLNLQWNNPNEQNKITKTTHHFLWLRDHCHCPLCIDEISGNRLFRSEKVGQKVEPSTPVRYEGENLYIEWSDGHKSNYPLEFLKSHNHEGIHKNRFESDDPLFNVAEEWTKDSLNLKKFDYKTLQDDKGRIEAVKAIAKDGIILLNEVPLDKGTVANVGSRFGLVRETFYGRIFDVINVPQAINIAYTSKKLSYHQDLLYFESPPGLQLLHCLEFSQNIPSDTGATLFVDGLAVARELKRRDPDAYRLLSLVPVPYHYKVPGQTRRFSRPMISLEKVGPTLRGDSWELGMGDEVVDGCEWSRIKCLNVSAGWQGYLNLPLDLVEEFYRSYQAFTDIINSPQYTFRHRLEPGQLVLFHNRRLLHGREEFDPSLGGRHLQGTYVDLDDFYSLYLSNNEI